MTHYLLSVIHDWDALDFDSPETQQSFADTEAFNKDLQGSGHWLFAGGLLHPDSSTVVDGTKAEPIISDGPYVETKEQLGGFWVIEAADLDEALAIAGRASGACRHPVEVRPFQGVVD
ncbi:MAG: hypothetical protein J7518_17705 [Nocardioidaceae bacterium]|nr:hypothetical protein [Nocardioidaceae bacterium]